MQMYATAQRLHRVHFSQTRLFLQGLDALPQVSSAINVRIPTLIVPTKREEVVIFNAERGKSQVPLQEKKEKKEKTVLKPTISQPRVPDLEVPQPGLSESQVSQLQVPQPGVSEKKTLNTRQIWQAIAGFTSLAVIVISVLTVGILFLPNLYYQIFPGDALPVVAQTAGTPLGGSFETPETPQVVTHYEPPFDPSLPEGDWITIPRIGVRTELQKTEDIDEALNKGVWWVPDFGNPGDLENPMIVAAHRYGWRWWWNTLADPENPQSVYALRHSFYNLPTTEPGDQIEIISGQRKYIYEIYAGEEGDEITDYEADLILYTCKFLNSPLRHIRYARLINPDVNTQGNSGGLESTPLLQQLPQ